MERRRRNVITEDLMEELQTVRTEEETEVEFLAVKPARNVGGRPGKFQEYMIDEIFRLAQFGLTNEEIAKFYGIHQATLEKYISLYPELNSQLTQGRTISSMKVVESLYKQAIGYDIEEKTYEYYYNKDGDKILKGEKTVKKHIGGSAVAGTFLLRTRHPDRWSETIRNENSTRIDINIQKMDLSDITTEELMLMKKIGLKTIPIQAEK